MRKCRYLLFTVAGALLFASLWAHRFIAFRPMNPHQGLLTLWEQGRLAPNNPLLLGPFITPFVIVEPVVPPARMPLHHSEAFTTQGGYLRGLPPGAFYFADPRSLEYRGPFLLQQASSVPMHHFDRFTRRGAYLFGLDPWGFYFAEPVTKNPGTSRP
jgi:hypothetical protein